VASGERTFNVLKQVENCCRSGMGQFRLVSPPSLCTVTLHESYIFLNDLYSFREKGVFNKIFFLN
jgi:hypothetical protein